GVYRHGAIGQSGAGDAGVDQRTQRRPVLRRPGGGAGLRRSHAQGPAGIARAANLAAADCRQRQGRGVGMTLANVQARARQLPALLAGLAATAVPEVAITGVSLDSRRVRPGDLFLACPGLREHGLDHAAEAIAAGAVAVAWDADRPAQLTVPNVRVEQLAAHC